MYRKQQILCKSHNHALRTVCIHQLGTFFVNGEWACSPFVKKSGHADNPANFAPCVKSMTANFIRKIHNVPHGGLPYNFVRRINLCYLENLPRKIQNNRP